MSLTCGMAIYLFLLSESGHNHEIRPISGLQWNDFRQDCGINTFLKEPQRAIAKFDRIY
jgi:hypothetical protein